MEFVGFLLILACVLAVVWYYRSPERNAPKQIKACDPEELLRSKKLLSETDVLLEQIRGISTRHDAFFERYLGLLKEVQRLDSGTCKPSDNGRNITHRVLALKQQVEKEKGAFLTF
jgi:hypothetical protein